MKNSCSNALFSSINKRADEIPQLALAIKEEAIDEHSLALPETACDCNVFSLIVLLL